MTTKPSFLIASLLGVFIYLNSSTLLASSQSFKSLRKMSKASLVVEDEPEYSLRANEKRVPASTLKILTALLALKAWNPEHRFVTDFYLDNNLILWVKGYGDPYITSEELDKIVLQLKKRGLKKINGIGIDSSYFADNLHIDGRSRSNNPYDAPSSAIALNFNTISILKNRNGIQSAEKQTPLTPLMYSLAQKLSNGKHRININEQHYCPQYFAEVLAAKLHAQGVLVSGNLTNGYVSPLQPIFYQHKNSHTLSEVISSMLKYSNNFIANQLFLMLGVKHYGIPATIEKSKMAFSSKVKVLFGWDKVFYEGAGLSRNNRLSAKEMIEILKKFAPYKHLLKKQNSRILAKTGTLRGVSSYAGYLYKAKKWRPFALLINQSVNGNFRKKLAKELLK